MRGIYGLLFISNFALAAQSGIQLIPFSNALSPPVLGQGCSGIPELSIIIKIACF